MKKKILVIGHKHTEAPMVIACGDFHIGKKINKKEIDTFFKKYTNHDSFLKPMKLNILERLVLTIVNFILKVTR